MLHEKFPKFTTIPCIYGVLQVKFYIYYCKAFPPQTLISANNAIHLNSHVTYMLDKVLWLYANMI